MFAQVLRRLRPFLLLALLIPSVYAQSLVWSPQSSGTTNQLRDVWASDPGNVWAVGLGGTIVKSNGSGTWTPQVSGVTSSLFGIWGTSSTNAWTVGGSGRILRWDGTKWNTQTSGTTRILFCVWGSSQDNVWAAGEAGTFTRWNGNSWTSGFVGANIDFTGMWGSGANDIWMVGTSAATGNGVVYRFNGTSWNPDNSIGTVNGLNDVWGSGANNVWAVGSGGLIMRWNGSAWASVPSGTTVDLTSVWGSAANNVHAVGFSGNILRYDGTSWKPQTSGTTERLNAVFGSSATALYAAGGGFGSSTLLSGTLPVFAPEIAVEQPADTDIPDAGTQDFGTSTTGVSKSLRIFIKNTGNAPLTGLALTRSGTHTGDFTVTTPPPASVIPGGTGSFVVQFTPSAAGIRTAAIQIASNDANENPFDINLTGTGISPAPEIVVEQPLGTDLPDPGALAFGSVTTGSSNSLTIHIKNTGNANLTGLAMTRSGTHAADFTVMTPPAAPVAAGDRTSFVVKFAPSGTGNRTAVLRIASNDANENPFDINLSGTGIAPEIAVEQPPGKNMADGGSKAFGTVSLGSKASLTFTIKNTGTSNLTGLGITKDGANPADFNILTRPVSPVAGGNTTTFTVEFSPALVGIKSATLRIASNDANEDPFDINLTGTCIAPEIEVRQPLASKVIDNGKRSFGSVLVGASKSLTFTIKNTGSADLTGLTITKDGVDTSDFTVTADPTAPVIAGGSTTFTVQFSPKTTGAKKAVIRIANNDGNEAPFDINLTGKATAPEIVVQQPADTDLADGGSQDFGSLKIASSKSLKIFIKNTGTGALSGLAVNISGTHADDFTVTTPPPATISAGGSSSFVVKFTPSATGARTAAIQIASTDADENPFDLTLTGTGFIPNKAPVLFAVGVLPATLSATHPENTPVVMGVIGVTDADSGQTHTWALGGKDAGKFQLSPSTIGGALQFAFKTAPDFEKPTDVGADNVYEVTITATDSGSPALSDSVALSLTVTDENDAPPTISTIAAQSTNEDTAAVIPFTVGDDAGQDLDTLAFEITSDNETLIPAGNIVLGGSGANRTLTITPAANLSGSAKITVLAIDGFLSAERTFTLTVNPVNDAPTFTLPENITRFPGGGAYTQAGVVSAISRGAANESTQTIALSLPTVTNPTLFTVAPTLAANGTLRFTPGNTAGTSTVTVRAQDNGGTENGGVNFTQKTFTIAISSLAVTFADVTMNEDSTLAVGPAGFTGSPGPILNKITASSNPTLIPFDANAAAAATVTLTPAANQSGTSTITVASSDEFATVTNTFTVTVNAINDAPTFTLPAEPAWTPRDESRLWTSITSSADGTKLAATARRNTGTVTVDGAIWISNDSGLSWTKKNPANDFSSITSSADGSKLAAVVFDGQIYTSTDSGATWTARASSNVWQSITSSADGNKLAAAYKGKVHTSIDSGVTWTEQASSFGGDSITSSADGNKLAAAGGQLSTSEGPRWQNVAALSGTFTQANFATAISPGPADESAQTVSFTVTTDKPELFNSLPAIAPNGTLTFSPGRDAGNTTVTVRAVDTGGTANGGVNFSEKTFTIVITKPLKLKEFVFVTTQDMPFKVSRSIPEGQSEILIVTSETYGIDNNLPIGLITAGDSGIFTLTPTTVSGLGVYQLKFTNDMNFEDLPDAKDGGDTYYTKLGVGEVGSPLGRDQALIEITVTDVNEMPKFTIVKDATQTLPTTTVPATVAPQIIPGWATGIDDGDSRATQSLNFTFTPVSGAFRLSAGPAIDPATGNLTFTPSGTTGTARYRVKLTDDASINGDAALTTAEQTFDLVFTAPPTSPAPQASALASWAEATLPLTTGSTSADGVTALTTVVIENGLKYNTLLIQKTATTDPRRIVEVSPDLMNWYSGKNHTTVLQDDASILKVRDNTPFTAEKKRYIRLKATQP